MIQTNLIVMKADVYYPLEYHRYAQYICTPVYVGVLCKYMYRQMYIIHSIVCCFYVHLMHNLS